MEANDELAKTAPRSHRIHMARSSGVEAQGLEALALGSQFVQALRPSARRLEAAGARLILALPLLASRRMLLLTRRQEGATWAALTVPGRIPSPKEGND